MVPRGLAALAVYFLVLGAYFLIFDDKQVGGVFIVLLLVTLSFVFRKRSRACEDGRR